MPTSKEWVKAYWNKPLKDKVKLALTLAAIIIIFAPMFVFGRVLLITTAPFKALAYLLMWKPNTALDALKDALETPLSLKDVF